MSWHPTQSNASADSSIEMVGGSSSTRLSFETRPKSVPDSAWRLIHNDGVEVMASNFRIQVTSRTVAVAAEVPENLNKNKIKKSLAVSCVEAQKIFYLYLLRGKVRQQRRTT